jgi:hypothetical protein
MNTNRKWSRRLTDQLAILDVNESFVGFLLILLKVIRVERVQSVGRHDDVPVRIGESKEIQDFCRHRSENPRCEGEETDRFQDYFIQEYMGL